jgi:hypothetical protein
MNPSKDHHTIWVARAAMNGKLVSSFAAIASQGAVVIAAMKSSSEWVVGVFIPQIRHRRAHVRV